MAYSISSNGIDFIKILQHRTGPTGTAVIECLKSAYSIGRTLYTADQSQNIASQLTDGLGVYNDDKKCATAVDKAEREARNAGEAPEVTLREIQDATHGGEWQNTTDDLVHGVVNFTEDGLKVLHDIHG